MKKTVWTFGLTSGAIISVRTSCHSIRRMRCRRRAQAVRVRT
jgi:hypothetical protein